MSTPRPALPAAPRGGSSKVAEPHLLETAAISVRSVTKVYETTRARTVSLDRVSLDIVQGEFITLVGPSGCGKSTLLNLIAGLLMPTSGEVLVDGRPVTGPGPDRGVIFQQYALFPWLTAQQNVEFGLRLQKLGAQERSDRARHYLRLVGLQDFGNALPKELSGGMKQTLRHRARLCRQTLRCC